jgi:hypothetical protein
VKSALSVLLNAFRFAKIENTLSKFFSEAFDREADPCLEGRVGRLQEFIEQSAAYWRSGRGGGGGGGEKENEKEAEGEEQGEGAEDVEMILNWRDFNLIFEDSAANDRVAGLAECMRVYINSAQYKYSKKTGRKYQDVRQDFAKQRENLQGLYFCLISLPLPHLPLVTL